MNISKLGYSLSNQGYVEEIENEVRNEHPNWSDKKVVTEALKIRKKLTLFNDKNRKPKKSKKVKESK